MNMTSIAIPGRKNEAHRARVEARLPERARKKLERWQADAADADALRQRDNETLIELQREKTEAARDLAEVRSFDARGMLFTERHEPNPDRPGSVIVTRERDEAKLENAQRAVAQAQDKIDRLRDRQRERGAMPTMRIENYLKQLPIGLALVEHDGSLAKRMPTESWQQAVERVRGAIENLKHEAQTVALAPITTEVARQRVKQELDALAARGRPGTLNLLERAGGVRWPTQPLEGVALTAGYIPQLPDTLALLAWLFPDQISTALDRVLSEDADDENAMSDTDRKARLKNIAVEILTLEYDEESLIEQAEAAGISIHRRGDADPRALLGLASSLPGPKQ